MELSTRKPNRPAAAPSDSAPNTATAVPSSSAPPQPPQDQLFITEMTSVSDAGLLAADNVESVVPRIAQRVAGGSLRLDGSVRECIAALRDSSATFASSVRRVAQHRSRWLDKQAEECDGVEKLFRACARVCDAPMVSEDMMIEASVGAVLPLLACDSLPRLSGFVNIDGVEACQFAGVLSASTVVQCGVGRVDVSGTGLEVCLPGEDAASIKNNSVQVSILDDFRVAIPGLLLTDFTIAVTDECGSSVGTLISPTLCDDSAVRFSYSIPTTLLTSSRRVRVELFGEPILSQEVQVRSVDALPCMLWLTCTPHSQVAYGFSGKYLETISVGDAASPNGIAISSNDSLVVIVARPRLQVRSFPSFDLIRVFGEKGVGPGQFHSPVKVCFAPLSGNILVAETVNERVQEVTVGGEHVRFIGVGVPDGEVASVAANTSHIAAGNQNLGAQVYLFEAASGAFVRSISRYGYTPGDLNMCLGIRFSPDGDHLVIAEYGNQRVSVMSLTGELVKYLPSPQLESAAGLLDVECASNGDIAFTAPGSLHIWPSTILASPTGIDHFATPLCITSFGTHSFGYPTGLATAGGRLYVIDRAVVSEVAGGVSGSSIHASSVVHVFM